MTPSNSIAVKLVRRPARAASFVLRSLWATIVLFVVCLLWLALFVLFLPFLLLNELFGRSGRVKDIHDDAAKIPGMNAVTAVPLRSDESTNDHQFVFDRRKDVSKLFGCNTRNVEYRWQLFARRLSEIKNEIKEPHALDFGAGSLRDTYELASQGFRVTSFDLNETVLLRYFESYDWVPVRVRPRLLTGSLQDLLEQNLPNSVDVVLAFDVVEHLEDPSSYVQALNTLLSERGYLFTIVPNKRSLFEKYFKHSLRKQKERGIVLEPGVPHLQFKSPTEWDVFFKANGFRIVDRDMAIGHLVNDWWNGLLSLPLRAFVYPVLEVVAFYGKREISPGRIEQAFCPVWLMERINVLDMFLKRWLAPRFGWNLIVAQKQI